MLESHINFTNYSSHANSIVHITISFRLTSSQDSTSISFSLTCNTTGGPVSSVIWTRDGLLLDNTGPLVLTNASTASYTNVLEVNNRTPGTYTCQKRGADNQILGSKDFAVDGMLLCAIVIILVKVNTKLL